METVYFVKEITVSIFMAIIEQHYNEFVVMVFLTL